MKGTDRGGRASIQAIKKYLVRLYRMNMITQKEKLFQFIRDSVASGLLVQVSGSGGTGSVRLSDRGEAVLAAKLRPPPPAPTPPPSPPPSSSTSSVPNPQTTAAAEVAQVRVATQAPVMPIVIASPPPPPPPPAPIPTLPVASTTPAPSTAAATSTSTSGDLPVDVPIKIEASAEAAPAVVVSSAPEVIPLANLPVSRATSTSSSSPSSTQSSPSSLQRQLAELKSQLKSQITEKHQLEEELKRVVNLFRDEETHPGRWCRACFSGPPDFHTSECCQQGTYYCCLACQHRDWRRHMPRCGRVKIGKW